MVVSLTFKEFKIIKFWAGSSNCDETGYTTTGKTSKIVEHVNTNDLL